VTRRRSSLPAVALLTACAACTVGPDYSPPARLVPDTFRGADTTETSFADLAWFEVFQDPPLQEMIRTALANNYDLRIAAERVVEARSRLTVADSDRWPEIDAGANYQHLRTSENGSVSLPPGVGAEQQQYTLAGGVSWELDFWGRYRRASEAAQADLMATEMARRVVTQTLVADLALAYFDLLELDAELEIARRTLVSRERSRELVALRLEQGVASKVDLRQAEGLVLTTSALIPALESNIQVQENTLRILMGEDPGPVERGDLEVNREQEVEIPVGLPSQLLERRPDIQLAEQNLIAANARIGEAKALLYPNISLTASGGVASADLDDLFSSGSGVWSFVPSITMPLFNAGSLRGNVRVTESQQRQAALEYLATLQQAFREVSDALIIHEKIREVRGFREEFERTLEDQTALSNERYRGGVTSFFEVLDSERDHFDAELDLVRTIRDELFSTVILYRALGGGWNGSAEYAANGVQEVPVQGAESEAEPAPK
jgi:multidrug efflux system outer membrane protein